MQDGLLQDGFENLAPRLDDAVSLLEMLSQPARLRVLCALVEQERSAGELTELCGLSQPAMSHHLGKLRAASLVETRREAQTIYYAISSQEARAVLETLHAVFCDENETAR